MRGQLGPEKRGQVNRVFQNDYFNTKNGCTMKNILTAVVLALSTHGASGQLLDVINEVFYTDDGTVPGYPAGFTTYRIYVRTVDALDQVTSVTGSAYCGFDLFLGSSLGGNNLWNHCDGGVAGSDLPNDACDLPSLVCFDTFLTIGYAPGSGLSGSTNWISIPGGPGSGCVGETSLSWNYEALGDLAWWVNPGDPGGLPQPPDNRVLIAQVTVPSGTLSYCLNVQIWDNGSSNLFYVHDISQIDFENCNFEDMVVLDGSSLGLCSENLPVPGGCTDLMACNYDPLAISDNGSCAYPGCTDGTSCNYDATAGCDDGTCMYPEIEGDLNCDGVVGLDDLLEFIENYGCSSDCGPSDINGDGVVGVADLILLMNGCC
ncbi:MAG: hypothetical protein RL220_887 [Bacteroidota bacterium]